jgi:hypothetical protein
MFIINEEGLVIEVKVSETSNRVLECINRVFEITPNWRKKIFNEPLEVGDFNGKDCLFIKVTFNKLGNSLEIN